MPKPANKPVIAVDIDDVLAMNAQAFVDFSNKRWGTNLTVKDYSDHWHDLWQADDQETQRRIKEYVASGTFRKYLTVQDAREILNSLKKHYRLAVLTARQTSLQPETNAWLDKNFSDIFDEIHYAGIWDLPLEEAIKHNKTAVAQRIGAKYLIEDQLKYAIPAAKAGIKVLLFGDYKWNQLDRLPPNVTRVKNWQEVLEYFNGR